MNALIKEETWGELGPAMRELPNDKWRKFVQHYVCDVIDQGAASRAYRAAGFESSDQAVRQNAWRLLHDARTVAAVQEESRKILRAGHPGAVRALLNMIADPTHRDHGRAVAMMLARTDPEVFRQDMTVEHKVVLSADDEALEQYRALTELGVTRDKMREVLGGNTLLKLEAQMKTIEHKETSGE